MKIEQSIWTARQGWVPDGAGLLNEKACLVIAFGSTDTLKKHNLFDDMRNRYPSAHLFGCSTAGEIYGTQLLDDSLVCTAVQLDYTEIKGVKTGINQTGDSYEAGRRLADALDKDGLLHVFVLSDGLSINGSELVNGLTGGLPQGVTLTGGLAGNGERFEETLVFLDGLPEKDTLAAIGFYGERLRVGYGSMGGWDPFGPERLVTRSTKNVLYELDGQSALETYKAYLGNHASGLPATGLLFPLCIRTKDGKSGMVRTILSVNEDNKSMTFAGDLPEGSYARLMKANFERLIDGAQGAAETSLGAIQGARPDLAILISCVGRKLVLKQRTEEELETARDIFGEDAVLTGFYSYGEISPFMPGKPCSLHNQTMTITTFTEEQIDRENSQPS